MSKIEIPGHVLFAFSFEESRKGERHYHVLFDEDGDQYNGGSQFAGAVYKILHEYPHLIEEVLTVADLAAQELCMPVLNDILNNEKKKDS